MRLNSANRAFVAIVVAAGVVFGVFAGTACWIFSMVLYKLSTGGVTTLAETFMFDLKERLPKEAYELVWERVYELEPRYRPSAKGGAVGP